MVKTYDWFVVQGHKYVSITQVTLRVSLELIPFLLFK